MTSILPRPAPHPLLPFLSDAEIDGLVTRPDGLERYLEAYRAHTTATAAAEFLEGEPLKTNPLRDGFELPHWAETDQVLGMRNGERGAEGRPPVRSGAADSGDLSPQPSPLSPLVENWARAPFVQTFAPALRELLGRLPDTLRTEQFYIWIGLGGNRSGKSEYCGKRVVASGLRFPSLIVCLAEDLDASRMTQQQIIWKYLPPEIKRLNNKIDPRGIFNVRYSKKGGFTQEQLVLPNGTQIVFKTYKMDPGSVEGWMLGSRFGRAVGFWGDESMTTGWYEAGKRRCAYCGAIMLWSFTPIKGMTPAIKEAIGEAITLMSLPAELLPPEMKHVVDCPPGHMPYLQRARTEGAIVQYFFSQFNPFGTASGTFYEAVKSLCRNDDGTPKASVHIKRIAYGYTEDTTGRKFPNYCAAHVVKVKHLPARGCLYQYTDPHGSRPYASFWVLVTPGNPGDYYIIRDWPDERNYGEWAVPTMRETSEETRKGWDGDMGPAQRELGWGVIAYKKLWQTVESIRVPQELRAFIEESRLKAVWPDAPWKELLAKLVKYPWHRAAIEEALRRNESLETLSEFVAERSFDARFCHAEHATEHGGKCLRDWFEEEQRTPDGKVLAPAYNITAASGKDIEHGCGLITDLLAFDKERELVPGINAPRLYVSEECTQVRWALENYTGRAGESGACKEWIDLLRHLAEAAPVYIDRGSTKVTGLGSY